MANKNLFSSAVSKILPRTDVLNEAGGNAYAYGDEAKLAQLAATGTLSDGFYSGAEAQLADVLKTCRTLVWNGPLGAFETEPFDTATMALAAHVAALTQEGSLTSVAGGGDTVAALAQAGVTDEVTYISTAGGAFLEWMEGKVLPGVAALNA